MGGMQLLFVADAIEGRAGQLRAQMGMLRAQMGKLRLNLVHLGASMSQVGAQMGQLVSNVSKWAQLFILHCLYHSKSPL